MWFFLVVLLANDYDRLRYLAVGLVDDSSGDVSKLNIVAERTVRRCRS
jgi:hypothetical protein